MRYVKESPTSFAAAVDNLPRAGTQKARILEAIAVTQDHGCLREDLERPLGLSGNTIRPRVAELIEAGLVEETDRQRRTRSGSMALVLVAVNSGVGAGSSKDVVPSVASEDRSVSTDSGVEASVSMSPPPDSRDTDGSARLNPYQFEVWAD